MLIQQEMIERTRRLCQADQRLIAGLMYGSFARAEGDRFSDIEFVLFFEDEHLAKIDQQAWVSQIAPVELYFADASGHNTAIFSNLIRGEFHFEPVSNIGSINSWRGYSWFPSAEAVILVDRTGEATRHLQPLLGSPPERDTNETAQSVCTNFVNWFLFGVNVLARGEVARALDLLSQCHRNLLWMVRLVENTSAHWPTPSKSLEEDISPTAYARFVTCTATLEQTSLWTAYRASWDWGNSLIESLAQRHQLELSTSLLNKIDAYLEESHRTAHRKSR